MSIPEKRGRGRPKLGDDAKQKVSSRVDPEVAAAWRQSKHTLEAVMRAGLKALGVGMDD